MGMTNTVKMRDEVDIKLRQYVDGIKVRTKGNMNDEAVDAEGFFRNLLNVLYDFNLSKDKIESAHNETIDLHCIEKKICIQVTAQNNRGKVNYTIQHFTNTKRFELYDQLHFLIIDRERNFDYDTNKLENHGVKIVFHDITTIFRKLQTDFDDYDKMFKVYDFVMKDLDKEYARRVDEKRKSKVEEEMTGKHIVEQMFIVLKKFVGFKCIYPRTLSKLYPFNTEKRTHDAYSHYCLKTNNKEIHALLQKVKVKGNEIEISDDSLLPFSDKLKEIFTILNYSLVRCIAYWEKYTEIEHHKISILNGNPDCTCHQCQYQRFDLQSLFPLLKEKAIQHSENLVEGLNEGYYLHKLGEPIKASQVFNSVALKSIEQKEPVIQFLAQHNSLAIYNFVDSPWWQSEAKAILPKIEEIDLHNLISQLDVPIIVRDELIKVKEDYHLHQSRERIEEYAESIRGTKALYADRGYSSGTAAPNLLWEEIHLLFYFHSINSIVSDDFFSFRATITKGVDALFNSYTTDSRYAYRYKEIDSFILSMMLFYVDDDSIKKIFKTYGITTIAIANEEKKAFIKLMANFFIAQFTSNTWTGPQFYTDIKRQEYFSHYRQLLRHLFNRVMLILSKLDLTSQDLNPLTQPFTDFLKAAEDLNHSSWSSAAEFLDRHIQAFNNKQIQDILESCLSEKNHRTGGDSLEEICSSAAEKAKFVIADQVFFLKLFSRVSTPCPSCNCIHDLTQILAFWDIADESGKRLIKQKAIDYLEVTFDADFYQEAAYTGVFKKDEQPNFLKQYITYAQENCHSYDLKEEHGHWIFNSYVGYNCVYCLDYLGVDFNDEAMQVIAQKSNYYNWLINFKNYNYSNFPFRWLTDACPLYLRKQLYKVDSLKKEVANELAEKYDEKLAPFYVKYLLKETAGESN